MLDLSLYPKFLRDSEGDVQSFEIMVVIGWKKEGSWNGGNSSLLSGSPKYDAILLSTTQQDFDYWDISAYQQPFGDYWHKVAQNLHNLSREDDINLIHLTNQDMGYDSHYNNWDEMKIPMYWYDYGLKIPYFEEKVDIFTRKYSINDLTLSFDNYDSRDISAGINGWGHNLNVGNQTTGLNESFPFGKMKGNFRLSDIIALRPIVNETVAIFLKSPSAKEGHEIVPVYKGVVTEYKHDDKKATIVLEDYSESVFNKEFPSAMMPEGASTPERHKGKSIPCQIGVIDRAPCIFSRVPALGGIQSESQGNPAGTQDILYFDSERLIDFVSYDIELGDGTAIHQSPLYIYEDGYWNLSQRTADENGDEIPLEEGGYPNFIFDPNFKSIYLIGSAVNQVLVTAPNDPDNIITLAQYAAGGYGNDNDLNALVELYYGDDGQPQFDFVDENGYTIDGDDETGEEILDSVPVNLFNLQNDTVKGKFRIHAFSKPEDVKVKIQSYSRHPSYNTLFQSEVKSYNDQDAHDANQPDDILNMTKCYNWEGNSPNTTSFVEITGNIVGRYRYSKYLRIWYVPTFAVDFGSSGSIPFNNYEVLTDTAYYMKSAFQCTHSAAFGIYKGQAGVFIDQHSSWVTRHSPALQFPVDESSSTPNQMTAPGGVTNSKRQHWHWNIDTIDGGNSSLVQDLGLSLHQDSLYDNTSQWAQQREEILFGPVQYCQRRNRVYWWQGASTGGNYTETHSYQFTDIDGNQITKHSAHRGAGYPFTLRLYNVSAFSTILIDRKSKYDYFANVFGRPVPTWDDSGGSPARQPAKVLQTILAGLGSWQDQQQLGISFSDTGDSANSHWTQYWEGDTSHSSAIYLDFTITERDEMKNHIQNIAQSSKMVPSFTSLGKLNFNTIKSRYEWDDTLPIESSDVIKFKIDRSPMRDVYNKVTMNYHKNYAEDIYEKTLVMDFNQLNFPLTVFFENDNGDILESSYTQDYFSIDQDIGGNTEKIIDSDYIRSDELLKERLGTDQIPFAGSLAEKDYSAINMANFLIAFHANQHTILKVTLPLKYFYLEVGDVIRFNELLGDSNMLAYGEDYTKLNIRNGQYIYPAFYVTKVKKRLDKGIEVECMQMHFLNKNSQTDHGWDPPDSDEYQIYGCLDEAATNYDPMTTTEVACLYPGDLDMSNRIDWIDVALMQLAIAQESPVLNMLGGQYFKQLDVDLDGIVSIHDIWAVVINIMDDEAVYGCMDGPGFGLGWGPSNLPQADNYNPEALIHIQDSCEYTTYACGPTEYNWNWCRSDQDVYDASWSCVGSDSSISSNVFNDEDCVIDTRLESIFFHMSEDPFNEGWGVGDVIDKLTNVHCDGAWGDRVFMNSRRMIHDGGLGSFWDTTDNHETPVGYYYDNEDDTHNPNSGIYVTGAYIHTNNDVYFQYDKGFGNGGSSQFGSPMNSHNFAQAPTIFMPITLQAGHKYIMYNRRSQRIYDEYNGIGYGCEYYIGSPFQNENSQEQISGSGGCSDYQMRAYSFANPTFVAGWWGQCRSGQDNTWGVDSWDELKIPPRIFTAPDNASQIPAQWDLPGPGWGPRHVSGNFVWPDSINDNNGISKDYGVSPHRTNNELLDLQRQFYNAGGGQFGMSNAYQKLALNVNWYQYFGDTSFDSQEPLDETGGPTMPFGYRYETCACVIVYPEGGYDGFGQGITNLWLHDFFDGFGLIDITASGEEEWFENYMSDNMGWHCLDNAHTTIDTTGSIQGEN